MEINTSNKPQKKSKMWSFNVLFVFWTVENLSTRSFIFPSVSQLSCCQTLTSIIPRHGVAIDTLLSVACCCHMIESVCLCVIKPRCSDFLFVVRRKWAWNKWTHTIKHLQPKWQPTVTSPIGLRTAVLKPWVCNLAAAILIFWNQKKPYLEKRVELSRSEGWSWPKSRGHYARPPKLLTWQRHQSFGSAVLLNPKSFSVSPGKLYYEVLKYF